MRWFIKVVKITAITISCIILLLAILLLCFIYVTRWRLTEISTEVSPDRRYRILFQEVGEADWPFGNSHAKITVYDGKNVIRQFREAISDDGARFREDNYSISWLPDGVAITFSGSEQDDHVVKIFYDGREPICKYLERKLPSDKEESTFAGTEESTDSLKSQMEEAQPTLTTDDLIRNWTSIEPDAEYTFSDGTRYQMVPVDRALGSSYYVLLSSQKNVQKEENSEESKLINEDPYNGMGGEADWITFIDDTDLGFSCLTFNGGDEGILFRTEDKGQSFHIMEYPSAEIKRTDGTFYNPFDTPEKVWFEDGTLFLKAAQGMDGDYATEELGITAGLYASKDMGKSFSFIKEISANE